MQTINTPPDPIQEARRFEFINSIDIMEDLRALADFEASLDFQSHVELVVFQMVVHPTFWGYFEDGGISRIRVQEELRRRAWFRGLPYWSSHHLLERIPDEGWMNRNHMNDTGATIYSRWLGARLGQAVNQGQLSLDVGQGEPEEGEE